MIFLLIIKNIICKYYNKSKKIQKYSAEFYTSIKYKFPITGGIKIIFLLKLEEIKINSYVFGK